MLILGMYHWYTEKGLHGLNMHHKNLPADRKQAYWGVEFYLSLLSKLLIMDGKYVIMQTSTCILKWYNLCWRITLYQVYFSV